MTKEEAVALGLAKTTEEVPNSIIYVQAPQKITEEEQKRI